MSDISTGARAARESARAGNGQFGEQAHSTPEVSLGATFTPGEYDAAELQPGMVIATETNTTNSPFSFAIRSNRDIRKRFSRAGMPAVLTVLDKRRAPVDGDTDDEITFDLDGEPLTLTFHRERPFQVIR